MNREIIKRLYSKGVKIQHDPFRVPDLRSTVEKTDDIAKMLRTRVKKDAPAVWGIMPQKIYSREGHKILYTMIETAELHESFSMKVNFVDEVWVPSKFCYDVFSDANLRPEVRYMPLGVDTELYKPLELEQKDKERFNIKTKDFVFFSLFGWSLRKGYDILLRAYLSTFTSEDNVSLVIASRKNGNPSESRGIVNEIKKYIKAYCSDVSKAPHILHIKEAMPEEDLPILYNLSNCFVLPSRGEGFGLIYAEAGACEIPVISSRCCGQMDFLNDDNSFLIDIEGYGKNPHMKELSSYYQDMPFAILGTKAIQQLSETMRDVYINYDEAKDKGRKLRKHLKNNFTWDHVSDKIYSRLVELNG